MSETLRCLITLEAVLFFSKSIGGFYFNFIFCILDKSSILDVFLYIIYFFLMRVRNIKVLKITLEAVLSFSLNLLGGVFFSHSG